MDERMLATVAVQMFNERALKISFECAICGSVFESRLTDDTRAPVLECACFEDYRRACPDEFNADGTLRERP